MTRRQKYELAAAPTDFDALEVGRIADRGVQIASQGLSSQESFLGERYKKGDRAMKKSPSRRKRNECKATVVSEPTYTSNDTNRLERIALAAYYKAQARGFVPGHEMDDWLEAQAEIDQQVAA